MGTRVRGCNAGIYRRLVAVPLVLVWLLLSVSAQASEMVMAPEGEASEQSGQITLSQQRLDISSTTNSVAIQDVWLWRKGRRLFTLSHVVGQGKATDFTRVVAYDLDSNQEVDRTTLNRQYPSLAPQDEASENRRALYAAVDEEGGRFFVPVVEAEKEFVPVPPTSAAQDGGRCANTQRCLVAVSVLDASTLAELRRIPLGAVSVDGGTLLAPRLVAMSFSRPAGWGESGKLLLLLAEGPTSGNPPWMAGLNATVHYVMQMDATAGRVDWVTRVDGCRSTRRPVPPGTTEQPSDRTALERRANEAVVFHAGGPGDEAVWVGCLQSSRTGTLVRIPLDESGFPAALPVRAGNPAGVLASPEQDVPRPTTAPGQEVFVGPKEVREFLADPVSGRILLRVIDGTPKAAEVWWVFDGRLRAFIGTIGIGAYQKSEGFTGQGVMTTSGLDPSSGRLYVLAPYLDALRPGGLFVADIRRTPVPQALVFPEFANLALDKNSVPIQVDYGTGEHDSFRRVLVRPGDIFESSVAHRRPYYDILEDRLPISTDPVVDLFAGRSLDLDEIDGVTQATYDAAARGYAARALFVGGLSTAGRAGPLDPTAVESAFAADWTTHVVLSECTQANRQVVLGFVGPRDAAVVDGNGSRGGAEAVIVDAATRSDAQLPVSRCGPTGNGTDATPKLGKLDWEKIWGVGLFSRPPVSEPAVPWQFGDGDTSCVSSDEDPQASFGDPVTGMFASHVECGAEEASGFGYARGVGVDGLNVSEAISKFRIYRDPGRGIVSRVESVARGIDIGGTVKIATVRGVAESWANGRNQPLLAADRDEGYDPNCDFERTAGTCFSRHIFGVRTPVYSCGPCGDEKALVEGLTRAMGANGRVRLRDPDETLRVGSPNGYIAAIQKPAHERFGDVVLNDDLLQTVVPVLEIIRYAPQGVAVPGVSSPSKRGLQVYQFAGVEVSSSYGIQCLLVYDEATNTCSAEQQVPGSLTVSLADEAGKPLAGGGFEVRKDVDGDGTLGLVDTLLPDGACVTADDGIGTCQFENLQPGTYLVSQMVAPAGYSKIDEPWVSEVSSGEARTVAFVNSSDTSKVVVSAADEDGKPLSGASFAVYPDGDGDGKVAADAQPVATCTTDATGSCTMAVPTGSYVLVQTGAPGGLELIEPVAFVFASGGQTAAVGITNYPLESVGTSEPAASPLPRYTAPSYSPPVETVTDYTPPAPVDTPRVSVPPAGRTIVNIIKAPGDVLRLLARDPKQAVAFTAAILLMAMALTAIRRRQHAIQLMQR